MLLIGACGSEELELRPRLAPFLWATLPLASEGGMTMDMLASRPLGDFLVSPGLWIGLAVTAVFLLLAVRLYRRRGPI